MSAETKPPSDDRPLPGIGDAYEQALAVLRDPHVNHLDAVVWLSAHLAAMEQAVHPVLAQASNVPPGRATALQHERVEVERAVRTLERVLSGDQTASHVDRESLTKALIASVTEHAEKERALLQQLAENLSPDERQHIADSYERTLERAPTRPHPYSPHTGVLGALAFRINARRDRVMNTVDVRRDPTPHPPSPPPKSGRWGDYLLGHGTSRPEDHD